MASPRRHPRVTVRGAAVVCVVAAATALGGCSAPEPAAPLAYTQWSDVLADAQGRTVDLWMYGGDEQGNSYIDDVLAPAVAEQGITLRRFPVTDTKDALNRVLTELQAGRTDDGSIDLVWVNGDNFRTGREANAWLCDWTSLLPNLALTDPADPLLSTDFGTPVDGCEAPWHKAQFTLVYDSDAVTDPPTTLEGVLEWARAHPGRFTYPAPPDFTGSAFVREVLYSVSGGWENVPAAYTQDAFDELTPALTTELADLAPSLWRGGDTYPADSDQLNQLYAQGEIDMTMTYGPATLTALVADGTYPRGTRVLPLEEGTLGNASFLGIPANAADRAAAMVVADTALSVDQQVRKADPAVWGQFTVLDVDRLSDEERARFDGLPASPVVPPFEVISEDANPELQAAWVPGLDELWRSRIAGG